jgi:hypothetical protein
MCCADVETLSLEAYNNFSWCLSQNPECYKQWVCALSLCSLAIYDGCCDTRTPYLDFCQILKQLPSWLVSEVISAFSRKFNLVVIGFLQEKLYLENQKASSYVLSHLLNDWKDTVARLTPLSDLRRTLQAFRTKVFRQDAP